MVRDDKPSFEYPNDNPKFLSTVLSDKSLCNLDIVNLFIKKSFNEFDKPKNENVMSYESVLTALTERAAIASPLGSVLKLNFGESQIVIDGTADANTVSGDDTEANCTVDVTLDDFTSMMKGDLNPMNAFMSGKMKIKGDMGVAMKLQTIMA